MAARFFGFGNKSIWQEVVLLVNLSLLYFSEQVCSYYLLSPYYLLFAYIISRRKKFGYFFRMEIASPPATMM